MKLFKTSNFSVCSRFALSYVQKSKSQERDVSTVYVLFLNSNETIAYLLTQLVVKVLNIGLLSFSLCLQSVIQ